MTKISAAFGVCILISAFVLVWVAMPGIRADVPIWIVVDGIVAQIVVLGALSRVHQGRIEC